jgi:hypothetical protein
MRLTPTKAVVIALAVVAALLVIDWELQRTCDEWCREHPMGPCCP